MRHPDQRQLVLLGGGHSHLTVLRRLAMRPIGGLRVALVAREVHAPYSGMLPGLLHGWYGFDACHIDLRRLAAAAGARLHVASGVHLDPDARTLTLDDGTALGYDLLSVNCGATPRLPATVDPAARVVAVKPISVLLPFWRAALVRIRARHARGEETRIAVVGAGAAGCELALALAEQVRTLRATVQLVDSGDTPARGLSAGARERVLRALAAHGIPVLAGRRVDEIAGRELVCDDGSRLPADEVVWATSANGPAWLRASGLPMTEHGLLLVDDFLRCHGRSDVFAAGDVAFMQAQPRPRAGVFAVRQGPVLADNLARTLLRRPLKRYRAQRQFLSIIALPGRRAVASRGNLFAAGSWVWRLKDVIDRRFMQRFDLPPMAMNGPRAMRVLPEVEADAEPYCAGCAAKLGADVMSGALADLRGLSGEQEDTGVLVGLGAPDDAAVLAPEARARVATIDGLRSIDGDLARAAALATNHALGDCHAMGARPTGVLAWATVEQAAPALQRADLLATMRGVREVLAGAATPLLGGHSSAGLESSLGVTVLGALPADGRWLSKGGLRVGDLLVLTKPLGVSALFAAPMRGAGRGRWIEAAVQGMRRSLADAAAIAHRADVAGATDVTGFGLLGHLAELARASGVSVRLDLASVPSYDGALSLFAAGIESTLAPANDSALAQFVFGRGVSVADPRVRALIDPQTCGGLLFGVARARAVDVMAGLRALDATSAVIGEVLAPRADGTLGEVHLGPRCPLGAPVA